MDEKIVEQALRDGAMQQALFDQLEEGIYIVDRSRRILYWNAGAAAAAIVIASPPAIQKGIVAGMGRRKSRQAPYASKPLT